VTHRNFEVVLYCLVGLVLAALYPASRLRQTRGSNAHV
jgi:hypothetical protein